MEIQKKDERLKSSLKSRHIVMMSLGGAIGAGLFAGSGTAIATAGPAVILAYLLAGILLYIVMYGVGQIILAQKDETAPGMSGLIRDYVGNRWAHFTDWVYWACWMGAVVAEEVGISGILHGMFPQVQGWFFALIVAVITTMINLYSVGAFGETEYWLAWIKVAVIIILIVIGMSLFIVQMTHLGCVGGFNEMNRKAGGFMPHGVSGIFTSFLMVIYSYGGSELAAITVSETEDPKRSIPKAIRGVMFRIVAFYFVPIFLFLELLPYDKISKAGTVSPFAQIFTLIHIPAAEIIVNWVIVIALFSAINSAIYATSRSLYSRMQYTERKFGKSLHKLSKKQVPYHSILFCSVMLYVGVALSAIFGNSIFNYITGSISYTLLIVWIMLIISALIMYFRVKGSGSIFLKIVSLMTLILLLGVFIMIIKENADSGTLGVTVFAFIVCLLSFISYRKPKEGSKEKTEN